MVVAARNVGRETAVSAILAATISVGDRACAHVIAPIAYLVEPHPILGRSGALLRACSWRPPLIQREWSYGGSS